MSIPKIALLLGAGASKPLGIPTTDEMAKEFLQINKNRLLKHILDKKNDLPDIETLIKIVRRVQELSNNEGLLLAQSESLKEMAEAMTGGFVELEKELSQYIRQKCLKPDLEKSIEMYAPLLKLHEDVIVKIFTTNYDTAIENVCKKLNIRFSDGFRMTEFDDQPTFDADYLEKQNVQIHKLHGSVNWWSDSSREMIFKLNLQLDGLPNVNNLMIYPAQKDDIFNYPYNILQSAFIRTLHEVDEFIVVGHKFADQNIVSMINVALEQRPNFKLTIVNPNANEIKKSIFKNHKNVLVVDSKAEEWLPKSIKQYGDKLKEVKKKQEKEENEKYQQMKQKIIGEYESSKLASNVFNINTARTTPFVISSKLVPVSLICPNCLHSFTPSGSGRDKCPKCRYDIR